MSSISKAHLHQMTSSFIIHELKQNDLNLMGDCFHGIQSFGYHAEQAASMYSHFYMEQAMNEAMKAAMSLTNVGLACSQAHQDVTKIEAAFDPVKIISMAQQNTAENMKEIRALVGEMEKLMSQGQYKSVGEKMATLSKVVFGTLEDYTSEKSTHWNLSPVNASDIVIGFINSFYEKNKLKYLKRTSDEIQKLPIDLENLANAFATGESPQEFLQLFIPIAIDIQQIRMNARFTHFDYERIEVWMEQFKHFKSLVTKVEHNFVKNEDEMFSDAARISGDLVKHGNFKDIGASMNDIVFTLFGAVEGADKYVY